MSDSASLSGLIASLALPWIVGSIWVYWLLSKTGRWNAFIILGQGYVLGIFLTTVIIRLWDAAGLSLHFWSIALILTGLSVTGLFAAHKQSTPVRHNVKSIPLEKWQIAVTAGFAALIAYRYATITQEILLRPLYPWDAWMNWAPKAVIWFQNNELTPFISPDNWLEQTGESTGYTLGAWDAWKYPITVPLIQLWSMLGAGTSDNTAINLSWLMGAVALGLALYGHLRLSGASILWATTACYALLNMPYINVQTMLSGYADLWVAVAFGCAVFALHEWGENRQWSYALLALILALMCTQLKIPGLIMGGIVLMVFLTSIIKPGKASGIAILMVLTLCIIYVAAVGVDFSIPKLGRITISADEITLPYIGYYELSYHPIHHTMITTTLLMINWNLLWYLFIFLALLKVANGTACRTPSLALRSVLLALIFIFFVYYFTNRYIFAVDYTQVNRALIYVVPPLVFYMVYTCFTALDIRPKSKPL